MGDDDMGCNSDKCSDCRFNQENYCELHQQRVDSDSKPCSDFEERT